MVSRRSVTVGAFELLLGLGWAASLTLSIIATIRWHGRIDIEGMWAILVTVPTVSATAVCRVLHHLDDTNYRRGIDDGLQVAGIIRLPEREHH